MKKKISTPMTLSELIDKKITQLSGMQADLIFIGLSSDDYNQISELINNVKTYMVNCGSYNESIYKKK